MFGTAGRIHRYRYVEEPVLGESLIWELLGYPLPNDSEPISIDLGRAEPAFRELIPRIQRKIAFVEKTKEHVQQTDCFRPVSPNAAVPELIGTPPYLPGPTSVRSRPLKSVKVIFDPPDVRRHRASLHPRLPLCR